jgi:hypothetical protein
VAQFNDVFEGFKSLSPADRQRLLEACRQFVKNQNRFNLAYGAKVQFKHSKTGAIISGTFIKMKTKYAEVMSEQDQHGIKIGRAIRWSVSPDILIPLTADQAKLVGA